MCCDVNISCPSDGFNVKKLKWKRLKSKIILIISVSEGYYILSEGYRNRDVIVLWCQPCRPVFPLVFLCSPGEEKALVEHIEGLPPNARLKEEIGELLELLLILGQELLAQRLQQSVYAAIKCCDVALTQIRGHAKEGHENETVKVNVGLSSNAVLPKVDEIKWKWIVLGNEGV